MEKMNQAYEKVKILVGMEVDEEEVAENNSSFMDDFNRQCTLSTKQVPTSSLIPCSIVASYNLGLSSIQNLVIYGVAKTHTHTVLFLQLLVSYYFLGFLSNAVRSP